MENNGCNHIVVTDYIVKDGRLYVKTYKNGSYDTVHIDKNEVDDIIRSYVCFKLDITEEQFDEAAEGVVAYPSRVLYLEELEAFFVSLYGLDSFAEVFADPDVDFAWRRIANGIGSLVFELESGIRLDCARLRELNIY